MVGDSFILRDARATALIGSVIGVPSRANMLAALIGGQALTATELAMHAGVSQQTVSSHLKKMVDAGLIAVEKQGRYRYFRIADARVADALEPLAHLVPEGPVVHRKPSKQLLELRESRMCYDHLAGTLGVAVADALKAHKYIEEGEHDFLPTPAGVKFFAALGIDLEGLKGTRRHLARRCLDWTERRPHVGGALGAALAGAFVREGWIVTSPGSRKVTLSTAGRAAFNENLALTLD